ncbi:NAD(P)-binding protein [Hypoxylon sp. NC0597]|nr:NAD(P)-binding protein [Hypoxylon sp. NC0597]
MASLSKPWSLVTQFWPPRPTFTDADIPRGSQTGRVFMVAGGNAGIGYELCRILVGTGATVYMATRFKERAEASIESIKASSVRDAARRFAQEEDKHDVLWNNAGIGPNAVEYGLTSILVDTSAPRNGVDFAVLQTSTRNQTTNYAASKAGAWVLEREFGRRHISDGVLRVVMNPGNLDAGSFKRTPRFAMFMMRMLWLQKPVFGAYAELFAGLSPEVTRDTSGRYIFPWGRLVPDSSVVRQDILKAAEPEELGGLGYGKKLWE